MAWIFQHVILFIMVWIYQQVVVFSRIFQRDVLNFLLLTEKYGAYAGGLFHFRKDQETYSIDPVDYQGKPLFSAATDNRLLNNQYPCTSSLDASGDASSSNPGPAAAVAAPKAVCQG